MPEQENLVHLVIIVVTQTPQLLLSTKNIYSYEQEITICYPLVVAILMGTLLIKKDGATDKDISSTYPVKDVVLAKTDDSRAKGQARKWAQEASDIKADANTLYGKLENGMRYVIHKNALPPERVSLRLHIDAGSLSETEAQRGVAHFLEHMVFNGTKTFPDATKLVPQM